MLRFTIVPATLMVLTSCGILPSVPEVSQDTLDRVTICNAGLEVETSIEFSTELGNILNGQAKVGAEHASSLQGLFLATVDVEGEEAVNLYSEYVKCINNDAAAQELGDILRLRKSASVAWLNKHSLMDEPELERFNAVYDDYIQAVSNGRRGLELELRESINSIWLSKYAPYCLTSEIEVSVDKYNEMCRDPSVSHTIASQFLAEIDSE